MVQGRSYQWDLPGCRRLLIASKKKLGGSTKPLKLALDDA